METIEDKILRYVTVYNNRSLRVSIRFYAREEIKRLWRNLYPDDPYGWKSLLE